MELARSAIVVPGPNPPALARLSVALLLLWQLGDQYLLRKGAILSPAERPMGLALAEPDLPRVFLTRDPSLVAALFTLASCYMAVVAG